MRVAGAFINRHTSAGAIRRRRPIRPHLNINENPHHRTRRRALNHPRSRYLKHGYNQYRRDSPYSVNPSGFCGGSMSASWAYNRHPETKLNRSKMIHFASLPTAGNWRLLAPEHVSFYRQKGRLDLDRAAVGGAELQAWVAIMPSAGNIPRNS